MDGCMDGWMDGGFGCLFCFCGRGGVWGGGGRGVECGVMCVWGVMYCGRGRCIAIQNSHVSAAVMTHSLTHPPTHPLTHSLLCPNHPFPPKK
jgi:hypothetical protein